MVTERGVALKDPHDYEGWYIFGESPDGLLVDIANRHQDVATNVPRALAETIIDAHNDSLPRLVNFYL
jgi:hypothetical protein